MVAVKCKDPVNTAFDMLGITILWAEWRLTGSGPGVGARSRYAKLTGRANLIAAETAQIQEK